MEFEYDPAKNLANERKHGIDFHSAQRLWTDERRVEIRARTVDEPRWLVIGAIDNTHWVAVVTYREQRVRIISVRRARQEEVAIYEG